MPKRADEVKVKAKESVPSPLRFSRHRVLRPQSIRDLNSTSILGLLRNQECMSRADLARRSGMNEGTVSRITSDLIRRRLVNTHGADASSGGRPGMLLQLSDYPIGVGVEIRRNQSRMVAATLSGEVLHSVTFSTGAKPTRTLDAIIKQFQILRQRYRPSRIQGIGVSVRGIVNGRDGVVELGNLPNWVAVPVKQILQNALKISVDVDNDVRLAAIAEYNYGSLPEVRRSESLLFAMVDDGVGAGLVLGGKLYCGPGYAAGEFGQMVIRDDGRPPKPDGSGCLESLASNVALANRYTKLLRKRVAAASTDGRAEASRICQLALAGEKPALAALTETCHYLGVGIANIVWGLNCDSIVIDSVLNLAWPIVAPILQQQFPAERKVVNFRDLVLRPASLTGQASMIGAATMPFQSLFTTGEAASA